MSDKLRKAAQLALEALECHIPHYLKDRGYPPITALRAALAQQDAQKKHKPLFAEMIAQHPGLAEELAQQDAQAVYQYQKSDGSWIDQTESSYQYNAKNGATNLRVLYAPPTPPAQKPLGWLDRKAVECLQGAELNWMPAWNRPSSPDPVPIFLGPPARATLTASEILNMTPESIPAEHDGALLEYARAVIEAYERKNGLKP